MNRFFKGSILLFLASATITVTICRADILFIDMDDSPEEIAAARRAAAIRGEKLVIFPPRTDAQQKVLDQIHQLEEQKGTVAQASYNDYRQLDSARTELNNLQKSGRATPAQVEKLTDEQQSYSDKMQDDFAAVQAKLSAINQKEQALNSTVAVNPSDLQRIIDSYQGSKKKLSTIIFSGHHDYDEYTGAIGSISQGQVVAAFQKDPDVFQGVKSLYGWGCYSATPAEEDYWNKLFPNLELLGGYDGGAPLASRPVDAEFLQGLLLKDAQIRAVADNAKTTHDVKLISSLVHSIPGFDIANTAVCTRSVCVGLNTGAIDLSKQTAICTQKELDQLTADTARYKAELSAGSPQCGNIPCDSQHSWLRTYYNNLRAHQHCGTEPNMLQSEFLDMTRDADTVIRLIDFREIYANFKDYYKNDIARLRKIESFCGNKLPDVSGAVVCTPPPGQDPNIHAETRAQITAFVNQLATTNSCTPETPAPSPSSSRVQGTMGAIGQIALSGGGLSPEDAQFLHVMQQRYYGMVYGLQCIPLNWVNPPVGGVVPQAPNASCADQGNYAAGVQ